MPHAVANVREFNRLNNFRFGWCANEGGSPQQFGKRLHEGHNWKMLPSTAARVNAVTPDAAAAAPAAGEMVRDLAFLRSCADVLALVTLITICVLFPAQQTERRFKRTMNRVWCAALALFALTDGILAYLLVKMTSAAAAYGGSSAVISTVLDGPFATAFATLLRLFTALFAMCHSLKLGV
jgi:hypothetical protein